MEETFRAHVANALEESKPKLRADEVDIELLGLENCVVKVRMKGACTGCPMSAMSFKTRVKQNLKKSIPEIVRVDALWRLAHQFQ